ncbi:hypothetical protein AcV7_009392 [Taiwanofungus camphoratus]|nr:hypothetical protein AcV7_009392 [Antrodia cinnamomea]
MSRALAIDPLTEHWAATAPRISNSANPGCCGEVSMKRSRRLDTAGGKLYVTEESREVEDGRVLLFTVLCSS